MSVEDWSENTPFYGTPSDYDCWFNDESFPNLELPKALNAIQDSVAVGAIVLILTAGSGVLAGIGATFSSALVTAFISYARGTDPYTGAVSYKATVYTINQGTGFVNNTYGYQYRYNFTFFTRKNYGGFSYQETWYHMLLNYA